MNILNNGIYAVLTDGKEENILFFPRDFRLKDFRMRCSRKKCRLWNWTETLHLTLILQVLWRKLLNDTLNCQMEIIPFPLQDIKIKPARHHMKSINLRA